jgi:hypothetical protein
MLISQARMQSAQLTPSLSRNFRHDLFVAPIIFLIGTVSKNVSKGVVRGLPLLVRGGADM